MSKGISGAEELPVPSAESKPEAVGRAEAGAGFAYERPPEGRAAETAAEPGGRAEGTPVSLRTAARIDAGAAERDPETLEVEKILEDGLEEFFASLPEDVKPVFKRKGEEAAREIGRMVKSLTANAKRLLYLISDWLKTIPGVNRYFLEQEAKIKADRIMALIEERKRGA
jgi:hypothetical protein